MRFCRFNDDRLGVVEGDNLRDISWALDQLPSYRWPYPGSDALVAHLDQLKAVVIASPKRGEMYEIAKVSLRSPIANPSKIMAAPANYRLHVEIDAKDPSVHQGVHHLALEGVERPTEKYGLFLKATSSISGPGDGISLNWPGRRNDHEVELAIVIGKGGKNITQDNAFQHVAGYTIGLDITARGAEDRSFRKSADSYCVLGPWLVTADEIDDPETLELWLEVNGSPRQRSSTAAMTVGVKRLIELASSAYTLHPGDVILTGTPEGVGPLTPGDIVTAGCSGIGTMIVNVR